MSVKQYINHLNGKSQFSLFHFHQVLLGFISAIPQWTLVLLPMWFAAIQLSQYWIASLGMVSLPYMIKWLWAPFLDAGAQKKGLGRFLVITHMITLCCMAIAVLLASRGAWIWVCLISFLSSISSTCYDILVDGYRIQLTPNVRATANAMGVIGYRLGLAFVMVIPPTLVAYWRISWSYAMLPVILVYCFSLLLYCFLKVHQSTLKRDVEKMTVASISALVKPLASGLGIYLFLFKAPLYLFEVFSSDYLINSVHLTLTDVTFWQQLVGLLMVFLGCGIAPLLMRYCKHDTLMKLFANAQLLLFVLWFFIHTSQFHMGMIILICFEHLLWGVMNIFLVTWLMSKLQSKYVMTQYALFVAVSLLPKFILVFPFAKLIQLSWLWFFGGLILLSLLLRLLLIRRVNIINGLDNADNALQMA